MVLQPAYLLCEQSRSCSLHNCFASALNVCLRCCCCCCFSPHFGFAHALCLGLAPWLAAEVPYMVEAGVIQPKV
jgi:hypothetical protein